MPGEHLQIYDSTLRDGAQAEGVSYSTEDMLRIARRLDEFGIAIIEGGIPGSNPKHSEFFRLIKEDPLKQAKLAAFGLTRRAAIRAEDDTNLQAIIQAQPDIATLVAKSWDLHVEVALRVTLDENLAIIRDSVVFLKANGLEVILDAEHFFDGYRANPSYAIETLQAAVDGGADLLALCDTNGGSVPRWVGEVVAQVCAQTKIPIGIHTHNDCELAVSNTLAAVEAGATHVQGTINGYGERCGNANLVTLIPCLQLKMGYDCIPPESLSTLVNVSHYVSELSNQIPNPKQPFVGRSAFAHKGGLHVSAIQRDPRTYEHINPEAVGNERRVLLSELSGRSSVLAKAEEHGIDLLADGKEAREVLERVKEYESEGFQFEAAEASFTILLKKAKGQHRQFFDLQEYKVWVEKRGDRIYSDAVVKIKIDGDLLYVGGEGHGPVDALAHALRTALEGKYPELNTVRLIDFKVRVLDAREGTAAKVRVLVTSTDGHRDWSTVGVSENIIEASFHALVDSIDYKLLLERE